MKYFKFCLIGSLIFLSVLFVRENAAQAAYDLKAESLVMTSAKCEVNKICNFTGKVKNLGDTLNLNFPFKYTVESSNLTDSNTSMSPGEGSVINTNSYINFYISGVYRKIGSFTLKLSVDPSGHLVESNKNNNSISLTVQVLGYDLSVETIATVPTKPMVNQDCLIQV